MAITRAPARLASWTARERRLQAQHGVHEVPGGIALQGERERGVVVDVIRHRKGGGPVRAGALRIPATTGQCDDAAASEAADDLVARNVGQGHVRDVAALGDV
jgi:hypothetical protein